MGAKGLGNLIGIMEMTAPERLAELRAVVPNAKVWLKTEMEWSSLFNKDDPEQAKAILTLSEQALGEFEPLLQIGLKKTRRKIKTAQILSLVGKLISATGACGTIALIATATNGQSSNALISSVITLAGTLLSLVVQFLHEDLSGAEKGVYKQFATLKDQGWKVRVVLTKVRAVRQKTDQAFSEADFDVVREANSLAGEVYDTLETLGVEIDNKSKAGAVV